MELKFNKNRYKLSKSDFFDKKKGCKLFRSLYLVKLGALELVLSSIWRFPYQISLLNWKNCQMTVVMRKNPLQITSDLQRVFPYDHCHLTRFFTSVISNISKITRIQYTAVTKLFYSSKNVCFSTSLAFYHFRCAIDHQKYFFSHLFTQRFVV